MELPYKLLEQIAFSTIPKNEEHKLIVMDKSIHEEHLAQPLQTNIEQFKIAVTFLTFYKRIFNNTRKINETFSEPRLLIRRVYYKQVFQQELMN